MADFVQKTVNKSAVPIADVTSFTNLIDDNPFGCVAYTDNDGVEVPGIVRNRERHTLMSELRQRRRQAGRDGLAPVPDESPPSRRTQALRPRWAAPPSARPATLTSSATTP